MARITMGLGTSHSPQLNTPLEEWPETAERLRRFQLFEVPSGELRTFEELVEENGDKFAPEITAEKMAERHAAVHQHQDWIGGLLKDADPDVMIVIGDDQHELFFEDNMPAISMYWGEKIPVHKNERVPHPYAYGWDDPRDFSGHPELGEHLIRQLMQMDFDISHSSRIPEGKGVGHAFAFIYARLLGGQDIPCIPVSLNTYYPPNQPTPGRCYRFGQALRKAVESFPDDLNVVVIGSGGLSHFTIDEELDRRSLEAMRTKDFETIAKLEYERMQAGSSEIKNWIGAAGALDHLEMAETHYVPCYRTLAGTGCAMAFAHWK